MSLALAMTISFGILSTSCVDNQLSPQVEAIRTQQVEWMKAKIAAESAATALQNVAVDYQKAILAKQLIDNAQATAMNDLLLKDKTTANLQAQLNYDKAKALADVAYAQALTQLEQEKTNLANAQAALAAAAQTAASNSATAKGATAATYYANYKAQTDLVAARTATKLANEKQIADNNLAITYASANSAIATQQLQTQKLTQQANLAAYNAELAVYNSTATDPASIQAKINTLKIQKAKYQASFDSCKLVVTNKDNDINSKNAVVIAASNTITNYASLKATWSNQQNDSTNQEATVLATTKNIVTLNKSLTDNTADLATKQAIYIDAKANSDAKQATYDALKAVTDAANTTLVKANAALTLANSNLAADPANAALITAQATAQTAQTTAQTAYNTAVGKSLKSKEP